MHIVLIAHHFPPSREVGALRAAKVARAFLDAGHQVTVIRATGEIETAPGLAPHPRLAVETVTPGTSPRQLYATVKAFWADEDNLVGNAAGGANTWRPPTSVGVLKRLVLSLMWLPDDSQGFIAAAAKAAAGVIRQAGRGTVLYSTSPPHSAHVAALVVRWITGVTWVMEQRDPWTDNPAKPWFCRTALSEAIELWLERRCVAAAALVVTVSEGTRRFASQKVPAGNHGKVILIRNGIDRLEANGPPPRDPRQPFRIVHLGTLYMSRDPRPFLRAVAEVVRRRSLTPADLRVELIGRCEWFDGISLRDFVEELGLRAIVQFDSWLPHAEAQIRAGNADLLLMFAEGQPDQVPNKLYEYLGTRRPMLVYADPEGETARLVRDVGGHSLLGSSDPSAATVLERALDQSLPREVANADILRGLLTEAQMARLVAAVSRVAAPDQ